ncbi:hypothetical protein ES703_57420 [subsurface metagenome]
MKTVPRPTEEVIKGLTCLLGIACECSIAEAKVWWTAPQQKQVLAACKWIIELRRGPADADKPDAAPATPA